MMNTAVITRKKTQLYSFQLGVSNMNERRGFTRSILPQNAMFFGANGWEACIIKESSKKGLGIEFHTKEKINEGSIINIRVLMPSEPNPVMIEVILKWINKKGKYFVGGVELLSIHRDRKKDNNLHY